MTRRRGFTLIEMLLAMVIGLVVISAATAFAMGSWQARRGWTVREGVDRHARFIGMALARDAQEAGVALQSTPVFASVGAFGDTLSLLSVPFAPDEAPIHPIWDDGDTLPTYPPGGNCGATCIRLRKGAGGIDLAPNDLVRLQVGTVRRLLLLRRVVDAGAAFEVDFEPMASLLGRPAGLDGLLLSRSGTTVQRLRAVAYWRDAATGTLLRAERLAPGGALVGHPMATGVESFLPTLRFTGGFEGTEYSGFDADTTNDGNRIIGLTVRAKVRSEKSDPAVNGGLPLVRAYEWRVAPRNLLYEKNR